MFTVRKRISKLVLPVVGVYITAKQNQYKDNSNWTALCDSRLHQQNIPKLPNNNIMVHPEFNIRSEIDAGKEFSLTFEDGTAYEGDVMNKQMHGIGRLTLPNGVTYTVKFFNNVLMGYGEIVSEAGVYVGDIEDWVPHGVGIMTDSKGSACEGRFVRGKLNGQGVLTESNGSIYEGEFSDNIPNGRGKYTCNEYTCEGLFEDFKFVEGTLTYTNGQIEEGTFVGNKLHGWGKSIWPDGTVVVGEYLNGEATGIVTVTKGADVSTVDANGIVFGYFKLRKYIAEF